jgi:hypothetical protein
MPNIFTAPKWGLLINPIDNLFQDFAQTAQSPDFYIWRRSAGLVTTHHIFASGHFEWAKTIHELADRAVALKAVFDGAMFVEFGGLYIPPAFRSLINNADERSYELPEGSVLASPFAQLTLSSAVPRHFTPMSCFGPKQMVFLARYDDVALGILKYLGFNGPDYRTLYSLLDWLKLHGWNHANIAAAADVPSSEITRFTRTANNVEVLGPLARHGGKNWEPPTQPTTLKEAQHLVLSAVRAFLIERASLVDLPRRWAFLSS